MKRFVQTRPATWLRPLPLTLLLGYAVTTSWGQSLPTARLSLPLSNNVLLGRDPMTGSWLKPAPADRIVTGAITDAATNGPLPGVNVLIKGTGTGTTTDANGQFRLNVPDDRNTLVFSYIGFVTQEVNITGRQYHRYHDCRRPVAQ